MKDTELQVEIFGRVQGVRFRHFVKEEADKLGVKGFVLNKDNGSVLLVAQGEKEKLEMLLDGVKKGPRLANISGASFFWREPLGNYDKFEIIAKSSFLKDQKESFFNLGKSFFGLKNNPVHVAIIPDGNRRWAVAKGFPKIEGYRKAATKKKFFDLLDEARNLKIKYLTFWFFSTENWKRDKKEIEALFDIIVDFLKRFGNELVKNKIRFRHLGRKDRLPKELVGILDELEKITENFEEFNLQICLDYGGRDEILRAVNKMVQSGVQEIDEGSFANYLDTSGIPDPDLVIRTSGEQRLSGFMPFQSAYSEFYFTNLHFPDFDSNELKKAVRQFVFRKRGFGG